MRIFCAIVLLAPIAFAQSATTTATAPTIDTSYIDASGTAHITRIVPVPKTISPEAQAMLAMPASDAKPGNPPTLEQQRAATDAWQSRTGEKARQMYPVRISSSTMGGVPVRIITPSSIPIDRRDCVLLNLHGGGFSVDSGSLTETIPIAYLTQTKVVAVLYRLAPEHPFPASLDDAVAVYKHLLKTYKPDHIIIYGTSAGAILTGELAVRLKESAIPLPKALGILSTTGDFSRDGDSRAFFGLGGLSGSLMPPDGKPFLPDYVGKTNTRDPILSPVYADLHGMPPTLFMSSTRDMLLSGTCDLEGAFLRAGDDANLVVFDALPHGFWNIPDLPESQEADRIVAKFFSKQLGDER